MDQFNSSKANLPLFDPLQKYPFNPDFAKVELGLHERLDKFAVECLLDIKLEVHHAIIMKTTR